MANFIDIKTIVQGHMRNMRVIKRCEISVNLYMLCTMRKPSVLLDFCRFDNSGLDQASLNAVGDDAVIFKLDMDYFIFKKSIMVSHLMGCLTQNSPVYIDVSGSNPSPVVCSRSTVSQINCSIQQLLQNLDKNTNRFFHLENTASWNLSTLFGVLLGYPVVYWFTQSQVTHLIETNLGNTILIN